MEDAGLIVLVGGTGSRLGGMDKARLPTPAGPLVQATVARLAPLFAEVILAGAPPGSYQDLGLRSVPDPGEAQGGSARRGPVPGLIAGLEALSTPRAFVCACDMPDIRPEVVSRILALQGPHQAAIPRLEGRAEPLHGAWRRSCLPRTGRLAGGSLRALLEGLDCRWIGPEELADLEGWRSSFLNLNTPEELERWTAWAR